MDEANATADESISQLLRLRPELVSLQLATSDITDRLYFSVKSM